MRFALSAGFGSKAWEFRLSGCDFQGAEDGLMGRKYRQDVRRHLREKWVLWNIVLRWGASCAGLQGG